MYPEIFAAIIMQDVEGNLQTDQAFAFRSGDRGAVEADGRICKSTLCFTGIRNHGQQAGDQGK